MDDMKKEGTQVVGTMENEKWIKMHQVLISTRVAKYTHEKAMVWMDWCVLIWNGIFVVLDNATCHYDCKGGVHRAINPGEQLMGVKARHDHLLPK